MKKNLLLIVLAVMVLPLAARTADGTEQKGWNVALGASVGQNYKKKVMFDITPRTGYRFNPRWELGGYMQFTYNVDIPEIKYLGVGIYTEFTILHNGGVRLFIDGKASTNFGCNIANYDGYNNHGYSEIGVVPGVAYRLPDSRFELKLRYLYAGYVDALYWYKEAPGCFGKSSFIFDAGLRRAELSVVYNF